MANPQGANPVHVPEPPYGAVKKQADLERAAPMSNVPAITAPERAKSRAVRPPKPRRAPASPKGSLPPYEMELAATWAEIAAQPGASDLVRRIALRAQNQYGPR